MIKIIHEFKSVYIKSLFDPTFYQSIIRQPIATSVYYLYKLLLCCVTIFIFYFLLVSLISFPKLKTFSQNVTRSVKSLFPEGLVLTVKDGSIRTNVDEPYFIKTPQEFRTSNNPHLIVFDTKNNEQNVQQFNVPIVVKRNAVFFRTSEDSNEYRMYPINKQEGFAVITRDSYLKAINLLSGYKFHFIAGISLLVIFFVILLPPIASFFLLTLLLIYLVICSAFITFILRFFHKPFVLKDVYHVSLHAITASLTLQLLQLLLSIQVPYTFTLPYLIWMVYILLYLQKNPTAKTITHSSHR